MFVKAHLETFGNVWKHFGILNVYESAFENIWKHFRILNIRESAFGNIWKYLETFRDFKCL